MFGFAIAKTLHRWSFETFTKDATLSIGVKTFKSRGRIINCRQTLQRVVTPSWFKDLLEIFCKLSTAPWLPAVFYLDLGISFASKPKIWRVYHTSPQTGFWTEGSHLHQFLMESSLRGSLPFFLGRFCGFSVLLCIFYQGSSISKMFAANQENGRANEILPQFPSERG